MIRLIRFLITGDWHLHEWERTDELKVKTPTGSNSALIIVLKCKHCGILKQVKVED